MMRFISNSEFEFGFFGENDFGAFQNNAFGVNGTGENLFLQVAPAPVDDAVLQDISRDLTFDTLDPQTVQLLSNLAEMYSKQQQSLEDGSCACPCCGFQEQSFEDLVAEVFGSPEVHSGTGNTTFAVSATGNPFIDAEIVGHAWSGGTISYAFSVSGSIYTGYPTDYADYYTVANFSALTAQQEAATNYVLSADVGIAAAAGFSVEGFTNLNVTELGQVDSSTAHIRIGNTASTDLNTAQVADFPGNLITTEITDDGDVWFGPYNSNVYQSPTMGSYAFATHIHEYGHALGLKHGHSTYNFNALPTEFDSMEYSIMTYRSYVGASTSGGYQNETWGYAQSFMMADIATLQHMYGADFTSNAGNTTYVWTPSNGNTVIDGNVAVAPGGNRIFLTLWDGNGNDTYDLSAYSDDLSIDLTPGGYSSFGSAQTANLGGGNMARGNVFNALQYQGDARSLIENAIGGSGDDVMIGNAAANTLTGGAGNDTFEGGVGGDTLVGGAGTNTILYTNSSAAVTVNLTSMSVGGGDATGDIISDIDNATGSGHDDTIYGNSDANVLNGLDGSDYLWGGAGDDTIYGGEPAYVSGINLGSGLLTIAGTEGNNSIASAIDISNLFSFAADADIADATTIPHVTVDGTGSGAVQYYKVTINNAGAIITMDMDYAYNSGGSFDAWVTIFDASGSILATGDDSTTSQGAGGSTSTYDSFVQYTTLTAGVHYLAVGRYNNLSAIPTGGTFELQVSVDNEYGLVPPPDGDDIIEGGAGADTINGVEGNDTASYASSNAGVNVNLKLDTASGGHATGDTLDSIENLTGSTHGDTLIGDQGVNIINGGDGGDTIAGDLGNDMLYGEGGDDVIYTGDGNDFAEGGDGADTIIGGNQTDSLYGGAGNDTIHGKGGNDLIQGDVGNDTLVGDGGDDTLTGGDGNDSLSGGFGEDILSGGNGVDSLYGGAGADTINGDAGADTIIAGADGDTVSGGSGNDTIYAGSGANSVDGGADDDLIIGGDDVDNLSGSTGDDVIYAQGGHDTVYGGNGNDNLFGNEGNDTIIAGAGVDVLSGGAGLDTLNGGAGNDLFYAGDDNDSVLGGDGDDVAFGGNGNDTLYGQAGNDRLYGQAGTNTLYGGAGDDNYYGGTSDDTFIFDAADGAALERVSFFNLVDTVQLNGFGFADAGAASSSFVQSGANVVFNSGGVQIVFYSANVGQVRSRVQVDGLMESPGDKAVVSEYVASTNQDTISAFLDYVANDILIDMDAAIYGYSYDDYQDAYDWDLSVLV